jgi:F1-F0 ATPase (N-ATPase) AtpR subunit
MIDLTLGRILPYIVLGALLAVAYFSALDWNVSLYVDYRFGWSAVLIHALRLLAIGAAFALCAHRGAVPLLSTVIGFQMTRTAAVNQQRRALERRS